MCSGVWWPRLGVTCVGFERRQPCCSSSRRSFVGRASQCVLFVFVRVIAVVSCVRLLWVGWRPGGGTSRLHIAVGAAVMDSTVHLWDLASPRIPHRTLFGHNDVVTGLLWHHGLDAFIWTCSKDGLLRCHDVRRYDCHCWRVFSDFSKKQNITHNCLQIVSTD